MANLKKLSLAVFLRSIMIVGFLYLLISLLLPKSAWALSALDCITHIENVTIEGVRYRRITLLEEKQCDLYMVAHEFPQLDGNGKPLPIQQQLRSIKAANDKYMSGRPGVRPVHSACVPNSKPWSDQTMAEREMCPNEKVNYYPVARQVLVPRIPELTEGEQINLLSSRACKELSGIANPSESMRGILDDCRKHYSDIKIPEPSITPEQRELEQVKAKLERTEKDNIKLAKESDATNQLNAGLRESKSDWMRTSFFLFVGFAFASVMAVRSSRKRSTLRDLANISKKEIESRVTQELKLRKAGPTAAEFEYMGAENSRLAERLQEAHSEKTQAQQQLADARQAFELELDSVKSKQESQAKQISDFCAVRADMTEQMRQRNFEIEEAQTRSGRLAEECAALLTREETLSLQLQSLYDTELAVRKTHMQNLERSIELARDVLQRLDTDYRRREMNGDSRGMEAVRQRIASLQDVLVSITKEHNLRSFAFMRLQSSDPRTGATGIFVDFLINDAKTRTDTLSSSVQNNLALGALKEEMADSTGNALTEITQLRAQNAEFGVMWNRLVSESAKALQIDFGDAENASLQDQTAKINTLVGGIRSLRSRADDLAEQNTQLRISIEHVRRHNQALRQAHEIEEPRRQMAELVYNAISAEAEKERFKAQAVSLDQQLQDQKSANERLKEAVSAQSGAGLLALEAPELTALPVQRLMLLVQQAILALAEKPEGEQEVVVSSETELNALNSFLRLPLVSERCFRLPPELLTNLGPLLVAHAAHKSCQKISQPAVSQSITTTIRPPAAPLVQQPVRTQTMNGLGAVRTQTAPYPKSGEDIQASTEGRGKPIH